MEAPGEQMTIRWVAADALTDVAPGVDASRGVAPEVDVSTDADVEMSASVSAWAHRMAAGCPGSERATGARGSGASVPRPVPGGPGGALASGRVRQMAKRPGPCQLADRPWTGPPRVEDRLFELASPL